uniref:VWFA domain-containing protein n=1 Tax=Anas platyrhynchos platyrhynchos TaxID=8840 RepID=U3HZP3_ANAPP
MRLFQMRRISFGFILLSEQPRGAKCCLHIARMTDCPISVYFIIDTSESIALQTVPIQSLVEQIKQFIPQFIEKLENEVYQNQVSITWMFGGLHYSDVVEIYSPLTRSKDTYLAKLAAIQYLGRGTFTDCAISNMTQQFQSQAARDVKFAVVITDGHVTGSPCGGMKMQAERARDMGIKLFVVAPSEDVYEHGLREIASPPHDLYRSNYSITQKNALTIDENTIERIIKGDPGRPGRSGPPGPPGEKGSPVG